MDNNKAFVASLSNIQPIEGADNIMKASVSLKGVEVTSVVVGKDSKEGDKVVYFDSNLQLESTTILSDYPDLARYLHKGRVKTIKLRGTYSDGLVVPLDKFEKYFSSKATYEKIMVEGFAFNELEGKNICQKYFPPQRLQSQGKGKSPKKRGKITSRVIPEQFNFHIDTDQLPRNMHKINPDSVISISSKWHGTSGIMSKVLVKKTLSFKEKVGLFLGFNIPKETYDILFASRRVVKNDSLDSSGYYESNIWQEAGKPYSDNLAKGETVYFEIVGYTKAGSPIQKNYNYGCLPKEHKVRVYRITKTGVDGHVVEYGWEAMKKRALELGMEPVEEFYFGKARDHFPEILVDDNWRANFLERLKETYLEKKVDSNLGKKVPDEGIVLRVENLGIEVYKLKSKSFLVQETKSFEKGEENLEDDN